MLILASQVAKYEQKMLLMGLRMRNIFGMQICMTTLGWGRFYSEYNVVIINEYFMLVFMGTPILAVLLFLQELRFLQLGTGAPNAYATYQPVGAT